MAGETKHGIECSQFEALLSEALDGQLSGSRKETFEAHGKVCPVCGPLFADARAGQQWMQSLEEVEPPAHLVHNILAATTGISSARLHEAAPTVRTTPLGERVREWWDSLFTPTAAFVRQPRFVMSFGMIFFSFSLALSAAGVRASDVAKIDLRPAALKRTYYATQGRVVKFYENIRFVYEIESRVREFKRATTPAEPGPEKPKQNRKDNNTSGQPDEKQERNYSLDENQPVLACLPDPGAPITPLLRDGLDKMPPAVTGTTNRRFV
jgi:Putative zinc-finger